MQVITERAKYLQVLEQLAPLAQQAQGEGMATRIHALAEGVRTGELLIPVVGGFSAGKSTLLNTLLGRELLPTAIRPETALATELHYSEVEYIEAFNEHNQAQRFELSQFEEINQNAAGYTHLKAYLNCELLRALEPAVLVDMPGFESPLDLHNRAINYYLDKGCLYLALISCQDGTVTATMMRQLDQVDQLSALDSDEPEDLETALQALAQLQQLFDSLDEWLTLMPQELPEFAEIKSDFQGLQQELVKFRANISSGDQELLS